MDNLDNFLAETPEDAEVTPVETPEAVEQAAVEAPEGETAEQKATRERDEKGRFKAKEPEDVMVPLKALHETRDEVKALKAELEKLRTPQQPQPAPQVPDIFENPEGFTGHIQNQIAATALNTTLNISEEMTRASAGNEVVEAAQQWGTQAFAQNPALYQQFISQRNPYGFLVQQYQRATVMSQLDDPATLEQFNKWREAQSAPQAQAPAPAPVPNTLADAQSARGSATDNASPPTLDQILGRHT